MIRTLRRARLAFLTAGCVPVVLSVVVLQQSQDLAQNVAWVRHTQTALTEITGLLSEVKDAETGQRGFLLTGNEDYLRPYNDAVPAIWSSLSRITVLTADNVAQQNRLRELTPLIRAKLNALALMVDSRRKGQHTEALESELDRGKAEMDHIRALTARMAAEERFLLNSRLAQQRHAEALLVAALMAAVISTIVLLIYGYRVVSRRMRAQFEAEERVLALNRNLEARIRERTAELEQVNLDLRRSNEELEQFAYVASHDLQEPLRMVASYTQLLQRRYKGKLDADGDEFIGFASEGAVRMQRLIDDLLLFSRVGRSDALFQRTDFEQVLQNALRNLRLPIQETGAVITHGPLPVLHAEPVQMVQVFQNLIGNAIKFRGEQPPRIHITAESRDSEWVLSFHDNGIGIDPQYADVVFVLFRRLGDRQTYPGNGIGLAVCKRIVERHGGRVWVESQPGQGSDFHLTIPISARKQALQEASESSLAQNARVP